MWRSNRNVDENTATNETDTSEPNEEEDEVMKEVFELFDINKDGLISLEEMLKVMEWLGESTNPIAVETMFNIFDQNKNGVLEYEEFCDIIALTVHKKDSTVRIEYLKAFNHFDKDKDGYISAADLTATMKELGEDITRKDIREMMAEAKLDKEGRISFKSFKKLLKSLDIQEPLVERRRKRKCVIL